MHYLATTSHYSISQAVMDLVVKHRPDWGSQTRLGLTSLDPLVCTLFDQGLPPATRAVYRSG